ncbi:hypothetical protein BJX68DRAFT_18573 [Aspergillus pseudodeflectus]|uniref:GST N-terminal domain-containing protein n=1 Tax=Aspergillus pseudodeflectus TaxID=176178 RepID=A0ABR4LCE6_9EURO
MATEIILYDLACTKGVCFSPYVWKVRMMLNLKRIPYKTIFLEFPDIEWTLKPLVPPPTGGSTRYTVPAVQHIPSNTYIMDSAQITPFLEATYPDPPIQQTSELGRTIEEQFGSVVGGPLGAMMMPREMNILSPCAQEYFRQSREAYLGHKLEDLLKDSEEEERGWSAVSGQMTALSELMRTNRDFGPFVLGSKPSLTDFFIAGSMQTARVVDEGVFLRVAAYDGFKSVYEACSPYMERND